MKAAHLVTKVNPYDYFGLLDSVYSLSWDYFGSCFPIGSFVPIVVTFDMFSYTSKVVTARSQNDLGELGAIIDHLAADGFELFQVPFTVILDFIVFGIESNPFRFEMKPEYDLLAILFNFQRPSNFIKWKVVSYCAQKLDDLSILALRMPYLAQMLSVRLLHNLTQMSGLVSLSIGWLIQRILLIGRPFDEDSKASTE